MITSIIILVNPYIEIEIVVETVGKSGRVNSTGLRIDPAEDLEDKLHNARVDGMESLLIALACEGMDLSTPQIQAAVQTAVDAIGNQG